MDIKEFQKKAERTDLGDYSGFQKRLLDSKSTVHSAVYGFQMTTGALDLLKKQIAYDAQPDKLFRIDGENTAALLNFKNPIFLDKIAESPELSRLFHHTIGIATEVNELMLALTKAAITGNLDKVNISEELGDILFYVANAANTLNIDLSEAMDRNIAKLQARYPNKFTEESANNRDLEKERNILEGV
jgi:NTP pyrophosphatase (non-canonical NTP hydrolase)